jgi:hypothetical protein
MGGRKPYNYRCTNCSTPHLKWAGFCLSCKEEGTVIEIPGIGRRIRRRAKDSERSIAKRMVAADGIDPNFAKIASSTGRIGHITGLRVDTVSRNYFTEAKNRVLPKWLLDAWLLINQRAGDFDKHALLHLEPPNMPRDYMVNGVKRKLDTMALITQTRHESLIISERQLHEIQGIMNNNESNLIKVRRIRDLLA